MADSALPSLDEADDRIGQNDRQDHAGVDPVLQRSRHDRGHEQHMDQHIVELGEEASDRAARARLGQAVRTVARQSGGGFGVGEATGANVEGFKAGFGGAAVRVRKEHRPVHRAV